MTDIINHSFDVFNNNQSDTQSQTGDETPQTPSSVLHKSKDRYIPQTCSDNTATADSNYQIISDNAFCEQYEIPFNTTPYTNDTQLCSSYWNRKIETLNSETVNNGELSQNTSRQMHWLNGGYFYADNTYRKYVYDELGTIHFSTSVKYDIKSNDTSTRMDYVPEFYVDESFTMLNLYNNSEYPQIYYYAPSMFFINDAFASVKNLHRLPQITISSLVPTIKYNSTTKKYESIFQLGTLNINNCGGGVCPELFEPENVFIPDGVAVSLSNGNMTYFPLTNEKINSSFHHRKSFILKDETLQGKTLYLDFVTPTTSVFEGSTYIGDVTDSTFNSYFINNSTKTPFHFVTTSVGLAKSEDTTYANYKFICRVKIIDNQRAILVESNTLKNVVNEFNEFNDITSSTPSKDRGHVLLKDIYDYMTTEYDIPVTLTLYSFSSAGAGKITLNKVTEIHEPHLLLSRYELRSEGLVIFVKNPDLLDGVTLNTQFALMSKVSTYFKGYSSNTDSNVATHALTTGVVPSFTYSTMEQASQLLETDLFDTKSSRFSTPDYSSMQIKTGNMEVIKEVPLRGSEYTDSHSNDHPIIRYVRKANGKFYIQILAGAFPYYHSLVHYPVTKLLAGSQETPVEKSLKKVCSKSTDWYDHVATTKWMCYVKHTEFGDDPTSYTSTEASRGAPAVNPPKFIGNRPGAISSGPISEIASASGGSSSTAVSGGIEVTDDRGEAKAL